MPETITNGVRVEVESEFLPDSSDVRQNRYAFAYYVVITNESNTDVQLLRRHWKITDQSGHVREVEGEGVVGEQPVLEPGESHEYRSGAVLETPSGSMRGSYLMYAPDGSTFDARIPEFKLDMPRTLH